jgi:mycofactocin precursor
VHVLILAHGVTRRPAIGWAFALPKEVGMLAEDQDTQDAVDELTEEDVDELLVEEVSIDGMCGVY